MFGIGPTDLDSMMSEGKRFRWFRFSLRTLFVVVTLSACWLSYQLDWIRQRHHAIAWPAAVRTFPPGPLSKSIPLSLRLFGEQGHEELHLLVLREKHSGMPSLDQEEQAEMERLQRLFPEACVRVEPAGFLHPEVLDSRYRTPAKP